MVNLRKALFTLLEILLRVVIHPRLRARLLAFLGATIGTNVRIYECRLINLAAGFKHLTIEDDVHVGTGCMLDLGGRITIRKGATLSPAVKIVSHLDPGSSHQSPICEFYPPREGTVEIGAYSWLGTACIVLPDVNLCEKVVVGAGSLVNKSIDSPGVYGGVPVKRLKALEKHDT